MEINKNNYEEFFLLYVDGELDAAGRTTVEKFAEQHANLQEELDALLQTRLTITDEFTFENKASLYKYEDSLINHQNYQEYLLSYIDNELSNEQKNSVEALIKYNPGKKAELDTLQRVKLDAAEKIVFENKAVLYRTEKGSARILPFYWMRVAAAASVILIASVIWWTTTNNTDDLQHHSTLAEASANIQPQIGAREKNTNTVDTGKDNVVNQPVDETIKGNRVSDEKPGKKQKAIEKIDKEIPVPDKTTVQTVNKAKVIPYPQVTIIEKQPVMHEDAVVINQKAHSNATPATEPVKPVIIDQAAFNGSKDVAMETGKPDDAVKNIDADNTDKKSKGKFRGLFRKAARFIDRTTNADTDENQSIVRVASFEIAKK
jgi:hypothetical protein